MNRRDFMKVLLAGGASALFNRIQAYNLPTIFAKSRALPPVQVNTFSSEIIMNSRRSYHGGYNGNISDQILANVLWA
ncbi:twin-arginine translocation signal domain-containing protein, partial [candidate division WOR-3 bacterium]|nr:twin-arginine translocation signal domain-containing protein [candidate division WOR-3 bacterium]